MSRLVIDAGAFIAVDRGDRTMWGRLAAERRSGRQFVTHAGIIGQVWRDPARQAPLARAVQTVEVLPINEQLARDAGTLLARTGLDDVHDACLALICGPADVLVASDIDDLAMLVELGVPDVELLRI